MRQQEGNQSAACASKKVTNQQAIMNIINISTNQNSQMYENHLNLL